MLAFDDLTYNQLEISAEYSSLLTVTIACLCERYLHLPLSANPLAFWRVLCTKMKSKVLSTHDSKQQHILAGALGFTVLALPFVAILYFLYNLAELHLVLDALILFICLQYNHYRKTSKQISTALVAQKKQLARDLLKTFTLRQTQTLSELGIVKATIESLTLRFVYQQFTVIVIYVGFGIFPALIYRLLYEAQQVWSVKSASTHFFGQCTYLISQTLQYLPTRVFNLLLVLFSFNQRAYSKFAQYLMNRTSWAPGGAATLSALSIALNVHTGGPVIRAGQKVRRGRNVGDIEPQIKDIANVSNLLDRCFLSLLLVFIFLI
ncbi:cobalamin biosynthesis protein CobD/CbiB [Agaribacter flavus]|uniref:Cobalamin biosynthesis protein n=1 Tax=Agaribacter flavus TaxID=1902781 RepID=A0ABV7FWR8_9ALTE